MIVSDHLISDRTLTAPLAASVVTVLGKYALDKGETLVKEVGPAAAAKAGDLLKNALGYLRRDPAKKVIADEYEQDPATYEKPVQKKLAEAADADPAFAAQLQALLAEFETAAQAHAAATGVTYKATVKGSGAIAQGPGAKAFGERAVDASGGTIHGSIITGSVKTKGDFVGGDMIVGGAADLQQELEPLLAQLKRALAQAPPEQQEEAEAVADAAVTLAQKATAEKPNRITVQNAMQGLQTAAATLIKIVPPVATVTGQIISAVQQYLPQ